MERETNPCGHLSRLQVQLPETEDWFKYMVRLQREFGSRFVDFDLLDDADRIHYTQYYLACISNELEEIRDWLPWKQHKKYKDFKLDREEIQFEIIDVLLYLLNICSVWEMGPEDILRAFMRKNHENIQRQKEDY